MLSTSSPSSSPPPRSSSFSLIHSKLSWRFVRSLFRKMTTPDEVRMEELPYYYLAVGRKSEAVGSMEMMVAGMIKKGNGGDYGVTAVESLKHAGFSATTVVSEHEAVLVTLKVEAPTRVQDQESTILCRVERCGPVQLSRSTPNQDDGISLSDAAEYERRVQVAENQKDEEHFSEAKMHIIPEDGDPSKELEKVWNEEIEDSDLIPVLGKAGEETLRDMEQNGRGARIKSPFPTVVNKATTVIAAATLASSRIKPGEIRFHSSPSVESKGATSKLDALPAAKIFLPDGSNGRRAFDQMEWSTQREHLAPSGGSNRHLVGEKITFKPAIPFFFIIAIANAIHEKAPNYKILSSNCFTFRRIFMELLLQPEHLMPILETLENPCPAVIKLDGRLAEYHEATLEAGPAKNRMGKALCGTVVLKYTETPEFEDLVESIKVDAARRINSYYNDLRRQLQRDHDSPSVPEKTVSFAEKVLLRRKARHGSQE